MRAIEGGFCSAIGGVAGHSESLLRQSFAKSGAFRLLFHPCRRKIRGSTKREEGQSHNVGQRDGRRKISLVRTPIEKK